MSEPAPSVVVLAGPNGAGKSTSAPEILREILGVAEFVNADVIAHGLSAYAPDRMAIAAGRIMLNRLKDLAAQRANFAFETTLASRSFAPWLSELVQSGYEFHLVYFWLPNPEMAISRVADRVRKGGHHVPADTIRRRYYRGIRNFFDLYLPIVSSWRVYNNEHGEGRMIAMGNKALDMIVADEENWQQFKERAHADQGKD